MGSALSRPAYFGSRTVHRLEHGDALPDVRPGRHPQSPDQPGAQIAQDVAVQIGAEQHVVQFGFLDQLHAHVVDDPVLEFDVGIPPGHLAARLPRKRPSVSFMMLALCTAVTLRRLSRRAYSKANRAMRSLPSASDDLDRFGRVRSDHVLDPGVEVLGVLPHDHQVDPSYRDLTPGMLTAGRRLAYRSSSLRRPTFTLRNPEPTGVVIGPLIATLVSRIGLDHRVRQGRAVLVHDVGPGLDVDPDRSRTPVAATATFAAAMISGPMPSPGMQVTRYSVIPVLLNSCAACPDRPCERLPEDIPAQHRPPAPTGSRMVSPAGR